MTLVRLRLDLPGGHSIGPGKIRLLELLPHHGSISAAARAMRISYRQAWSLLSDLNDSLGQPLFETATGGKKGGGARLTPLGRRLVERYAALSNDVDGLARQMLRSLLRGQAAGGRHSESSSPADASAVARRKPTRSNSRRRLAGHAVSSRSGRRP